MNQKLSYSRLCTIPEGRVGYLQFTQHLENKTKKQSSCFYLHLVFSSFSNKLQIHTAEDLAEGTHYFRLSNLPSCHNAFFGPDHSAHSFTFLNRNSTPTTFIRENCHLSQHWKE